MHEEGFGWQSPDFGLDVSPSRQSQRSVPGPQVRWDLLHMKKGEEQDLGPIQPQETTAHHMSQVPSVARWSVSFWPWAVVARCCPAWQPLDQEAFRGNHGANIRCGRALRYLLGLLPLSDPRTKELGACRLAGCVCPG